MAKKKKAAKSANGNAKKPANKAVKKTVSNNAKAKAAEKPKKAAAKPAKAVAPPKPPKAAAPATTGDAKANKWGVTPEQIKRIDKAFGSHSATFIGRGINNMYSTERTSNVLSKVNLIKIHRLWDEDLVKHIEAFALQVGKEQLTGKGKGK